MDQYKIESFFDDVADKVYQGISIGEIDFVYGWTSNGDYVKFWNIQKRKSLYYRWNKAEEVSIASRKDIYMNLFLPVYKRLEEDVIKLSDSIFFDDDQLEVYSLAIGDLLIRCVVEVEAISKELYLGLGGAEHPVDDEGNERVASNEEKVIFGGRLGEYKYYDMDAVIDAALKKAESMSL